mgnify:CR=1 FL=1
MKEITITEDTRIQLPGCVITCYVPIEQQMWELSHSVDGSYIPVSVPSQ